MKKLFGPLIVVVMVIGVAALKMPAKAVVVPVTDVRECAARGFACCSIWAQQQCPPTDTACIQVNRISCMFGTEKSRSTSPGGQNDDVVLYTPDTQAKVNPVGAAQQQDPMQDQMKK